MASDTDFYGGFQEFLKRFTDLIDPDDQLPIRISHYNITQDELKAEIINFALHYLQENDCPAVLLNAIVNTVLLEMQEVRKEAPTQCGFDVDRRVYQPLKLMQAVTTKVNEVCQRLTDNAQLYKLLPEDCLQKDVQKVAMPKYAALGQKNSRRKMEDRHIVINDFDDLFKSKNSPRCSYFALFDGHGGAEAAAYCIAHLQYNLGNSNYFPKSPAQAIKDAFNRTDLAIIEKDKSDQFKSGTTALVVLYFPDDRMIHVAWTGDSQALIVKNGQSHQLVEPHKATNESEKKRITDQGGVIYALQGIYRVQGLLAITRAIGDVDLKPYVSSDAEVKSFQVDGEEDFLIMGSDGLWDHVNEDLAAAEVYNLIRTDPDCYETVPKRLIQLAKEGGSSDNITVIVIYLKDPKQIAKFSWPSADSTVQEPLENMETTTENTTTANSPFNNNNFDNSNQDLFEDFNGMNGLSQTTTTTTTTTMTTNNKFIPDNNHPMMFGDDQMMGGFVDGNENLLNFDNQTAPLSPTSNKSGIHEEDLVNENLMMGDGHTPEEEVQKPEGNLMKQFEDDFGPETDVDAVDEAMAVSSPHSLSQEEELEGGNLPKEFQQFEAKEIDAAEKPTFDANNPFGDHSTDQIVEQDVIEISGESHHEEREFYQEQIPVQEQCHQEEEFGLEKGEEFGMEKEIEFGMEKELGFGMEKEKESELNVEKEQEMMDFVQEDEAVTEPEVGLSAEEKQYEEFLRQTSGQHQIPVEEEKNVFGLPKEVVEGEDEPEHEHMDEDIPIERIDSSDDHIAIPEEIHAAAQTVAEAGPTDVEEAGNVEGDPLHHSEEESDDEWNYIKTGKEEQKQEEQKQQEEEPKEVEAVHQEEIVPEVEKDLSKTEIVEEEEEKELIPEPELIQEPEQIEVEIEAPIVQESHALSQAIAESQEACLELNATEELEDNDKENQPAKPLEQLEVDTTTSEDQDMSYNLNPDAKEFVPLSPTMADPESPVMHGGDHGDFVQNPHIESIIKDDHIIAHSPRKNNGNTSILDTIPLPEESDFDKEADQCPHDVSEHLIEGHLNGGGIEELESPSQEEEMMNSKERRDLDEEKEDVVKDEEVKNIINTIGEGLVDTLSVKAVPGEEDPMNMSFHQDINLSTNTTQSNSNPFDLNAVQMIPSDIEEDDSQKMQNGEKEVEKNLLDMMDEKPEAEQINLLDAGVQQMNLNDMPESDLQASTKIELELTESESNFYMQQPNEEEHKEFDEKEELELVKQEELSKPEKVETPPPTPAIVTEINHMDQMMSAASPEPQKLVEAVEKLAEEPKAEEDNTSSVAVAAAATAVAAVAAVGVAAAAVKEPSKPAASTPAAKKDVKAKPLTSSAAKSSPRPSTTASKATPSSAAKASPRPATAPKASTPTKPTTLSTASARRIPLTKASPSTDKKPSPLVEKKTLSAPTSTVKKSMTPTKPTTTSLTSRTSATKPTTITAAKPATTGTGLVKKTTTTTTRLLSTRPASAPTAAAPARPKPTSTTSTASSTVRKTTTTTTTTSTASSAAAPKPRASLGASRLTSTTSAAPKPRTTLTKTTAAPRSTVPSAKPTTTTSAPAAKKPTVGSATARMNAVSAPSRPLAKKAPLKSTTTTTTTKTSTTAGGKVITKQKVTTTTLTNGDLSKEIITNGVSSPTDVAPLINGNGLDKEPITEDSPKMVIDLTAD